MNEIEKKRFDLMTSALFGDPENNEIGIVQMVKETYPMTREMHQAWSAIILLSKWITAVAIFCAAMGTAWMAFGSALKRILFGK